MTLNGLQIQAQCKREYWDKLNKPSHPHKSLREHIKEVMNYYNFLKKYFHVSVPDEDLDKLAKFIIKYHDMGKLYYKWKIGGNTGHSEKSLLWLICNINNLDNEEHEIFSKYKPLIFYLIAKHHGMITKTKSIYISDIALRNFLKADTSFTKAVNNILNQYFKDTTSRINLMDLYGLFKIADIYSADNKDPAEHLKRRIISIDDIKQIIGEIDEKKFKHQLSISNMEGVVLLRAPTGWGKTTTSLAFSIGKHPSKIFILLPTTTAIHKFYEKLETVFGSYIGRYFYMYDAYLVSKDGAYEEEYERLNGMFYVKSFIDKYINITTVDQFILSFMQLRRYFLKRFVFRNSLIVLDEIHLLTPPMLKMLLWILKHYTTIYNLNILMMSATLPINLKKYITEDLETVTNIAMLDYVNGYKQLRRIKYIINYTDISTAINNIVKDVKSGSKILVIVNTVDKAVDIARLLIDELGESKVILLHARMMYKHRLQKEQFINKLEREPHVLVSTQVAEVSLDISYDKLYTELAPLSSIIQRFGRINRYRINTKNNNAEIFYVKPENEKYPYPTEDLKISLDVLSQFQEDKLKNEYQLIKAYDEIEEYDEFIKRINRETANLPLNLIKERHNFIFSLDLSEDTVKKLLNYRESFTTLFMPDPDMISEEYTELRNKIAEIISTDYKSLSEGDKRRYEAEVKSHLINCPYYILAKSPPHDKIGFPIYFLDEYVYHPYFGLIKESGGKML